MKTLSNEYKEILQNKYNTVINTLFDASEIKELEETLKINIQTEKEIQSFPDLKENIQLVKIDSIDMSDELTEAMEEYKQLLASGR